MPLPLAPFSSTQLGIGQLLQSALFMFPISSFPKANELKEPIIAGCHVR